MVLLWRSLERATEVVDQDGGIFKFLDQRFKAGSVLGFEMQLYDKAIIRCKRPEPAKFRCAEWGQPIGRVGMNPCGHQRSASGQRGQLIDRAGAVCKDVNLPGLGADEIGAVEVGGRTEPVRIYKLA